MITSSAQHATSDAPTKPDQLIRLQTKLSHHVNSVMPPRIGSTTPKAGAVAALIAISACIAPALAFATPAPLTAGCPINATHIATSGNYYHSCECKCYDSPASDTYDNYFNDCDCKCNDGY
jgi:hypothetical protein